MMKSHLKAVTDLLPILYKHFPAGATARQMVAVAKNSESRAIRAELSDAIRAATFDRRQLSANSLGQVLAAFDGNVLSGFMVIKTLNSSRARVYTVLPESIDETPKPDPDPNPAPWEGRASGPEPVLDPNAGTPATVHSGCCFEMHFPESEFWPIVKLAGATKLTYGEFVEKIFRLGLDAYITSMRLRGE